jgi:hypothetical protein
MLNIRGEIHLVLNFHQENPFVIKTEVLFMSRNGYLETFAVFENIKIFTQLFHDFSGNSYRCPEELYFLLYTDVLQCISFINYLFIY